MSEGSIPTKKLITIIVITWSLSLVTTLLVVSYSTPFSTRTWHEVTSFSGNDTQPTDFFSISSESWRIRWQVIGMPLSETTSFWFWVHDEKTIIPCFDSGTFTASDFQNAWFSTPTGIEYITGSGRFQIEVFVENAEWQFFIEQYS